MKATIYNTTGASKGDITLPETVFGQKWNADLVHEVVVSMMGNAREGTAHTKGRGDVRGGGRKPWKQKGTGRARHGSRRSPIWRGGGTTFGPTSEKDYSRKINRSVRAKALAVVLSRKFADGEVAFLDAFSFTAPKAKEAKGILAALAPAFGGSEISSKRKNAALVVLSARDENAEKSFRNFGNILVDQVKDINPVDLLTYKYVLFVNPKEAVAALEARVLSRSKRVRGVEQSAPTPEVTEKKKPAARKAPAKPGAKKVTKKVAKKVVKKVAKK